MTRRLFLILASVWLALTAGATEWRGVRQRITQPDGKTIDIVRRTCGKYREARTMDGYALVKDNGYMCYAVASADGREFVSTGIKYTGGRTSKDIANSLNIKRGGKLSEERIQEIEEAAKARMEREADYTPNINNGESNNMAEGNGLRSGSALRSGEATAPDTIYDYCILVEFKDRKFPYSVEQMEEFINSDKEVDMWKKIPEEFADYATTTKTMSVKKYFEWISCGKITTQTEIYKVSLEADFAHFDNENFIDSVTLRMFSEHAISISKPDKSECNTGGTIFVPKSYVNILYAGETPDTEDGLWPMTFRYTNKQAVYSSCSGFSENLSGTKYHYSFVNVNNVSDWFLARKSYMYNLGNDIVYRFSYDAFCKKMNVVGATGSNWFIDYGDSYYSNVAEAYFIDSWNEKLNYPNATVRVSRDWVTNVIGCTSLNLGDLVTLKLGPENVFSAGNLYLEVREGSDIWAASQFYDDYAEKTDDYYDIPERAGIAIWDSEGIMPMSKAFPLWSASNPYAPNLLNRYSTPSLYRTTARFKKNWEYPLLFCDVSESGTTMTFRYGKKEGTDVTITVEIEGEGTVETDDNVSHAEAFNVVSPIGKDVTLKAVPSEGSYFKEWSNGVTANPYIVTTTSDIKLTAVFAKGSTTVDPVTPNVYTVAVDCDAKYGSVSGGGEFEENAWVTLTATAKEGYVFSRWSNGSTLNPYTFVARSDMNLTAEFVEDVIMGDVVYLFGDGMPNSGWTGAQYQYVMAEDSDNDGIITVEVSGMGGYFTMVGEDAIGCGGICDCLNKYRFAPTSNGVDVSAGVVKFGAYDDDDAAFYIAAGSYRIEIDLKAKTIEAKEIEVEIEPQPAYPMYMFGDAFIGSDWALPTKFVEATDDDEDGVCTVKVESLGGYFALLDEAAIDCGRIWECVNQFRYAPASNGADITDGKVQFANYNNDDAAFYLPAGWYEIKIDMNYGTISAEPTEPGESEPIDAAPVYMFGDAFAGSGWVLPTEYVKAEDADKDGVLTVEVETDGGYFTMVAEDALDCGAIWECLNRFRYAPAVAGADISESKVKIGVYKGDDASFYLPAGKYVIEIDILRKTIYAKKDGSSVTPQPVIVPPVYVFGDAFAGSGWSGNPSEYIKVEDDNADGILTMEVNGKGGYFVLLNEDALGCNGIWDCLNIYRLAPVTGNAADITEGVKFGAYKGDDAAFYLPEGEYVIEIDMVKKTITAKEKATMMGIDADDAVVSTEYFDMLGRKAANANTAGVYLVKYTYMSGKMEIRKMVITE